MLSTPCVADVGQHGLEGFEVGVDVAEDGAFHGDLAKNKRPACPDWHASRAHARTLTATDLPPRHQPIAQGVVEVGHARRSYAAFLRPDTPGGGT